MPPRFPRISRRLPWVASILLLSCLPAVARAQDQGIQDITSGWSRHVASGSTDWSAPGVADDLWPVTSLTASWRDQGLQGVSGPVWYRKTVTIPESLRREHTPLGVVVGAVTYGAWTLYANGVRVGSWGSDNGPVPFPRPRLVQLPRGVESSGQVVLALRVTRMAWLADGAQLDAPAIGGAYIGRADLLASRLQVMQLREQTGDIAGLLFAVMTLLTALYHLYIFAVRPAERTYLWFGLACIAFAVNALAFSPWAVSWFTTYATPYRLTAASGHFAAALLLVFLWQNFGRRVGRFMGTYVGSHVGLGALVLVLPFHWVYVSEGARFAWLLPGLAAALGLILIELYRHNPDARTLAVGGTILVACEVAELLRLAGAPLPHSLPYLGFAAAILSVAAMLAHRFIRTHAQLDELRLELEMRVEDRTAALSDAMQKARVANEAKTRFLGSMSHELRTPLNAVIGFANVLLKQAVRTHGVLQKRDLHFLERIRANGIQLLALVDDLLDLSRIEAGAVRLEREKVDVSKLVSGLLAELSTHAVDRNVRLEAVVPTNAGAIYTDPVRLKQILTNLVDNGVRFSPGGSVTVTVHATSGQVRCIEVADTGAGIPPDDLDRIFAVFSQGDDSTKRQHGGAGLGLAITKGLCDLLGYGLRLESTVGEGTRAYVDLEPPPPPTPRTVADTSADVTASRREMPGVPGGGTPPPG